MESEIKIGSSVFVSSLDELFPFCIGRLLSEILLSIPSDFGDNPCRFMLVTCPIKLQSPM
jgi:hypothetical protein